MAHLISSNSYSRHNVSSEDNELTKIITKTSSCPDLDIKFEKKSKKEKQSDDDDEDENFNETDAFIDSKTASSLHTYMGSTVENAKESCKNAINRVDRFAHKVWDGRKKVYSRKAYGQKKSFDYSKWKVVSFFQLQEWQKDNEFLLHWHRPAMPSFKACFNSIFRLHTETGNIWTHLIGVLVFIGICIYFLCLPATNFISHWQEKVVFFLFFLGAVLCLCFSTLFHMMGCHSERVFHIFGKLDYSGIALMIMGSFVPWIYYSFYCDSEPKVIYMSAICFLGILCIIISQWDRFGTAKYRSCRAILFASLGLSGVVPAIHTTFKLGFLRSVTVGQLGWLYLMAFLYLFGAFLYAKRIPERWYPGKCDLWFQSHQIFHILVVAAAIVHFHGISNLQQSRFEMGEECMKGD